MHDQKTGPVPDDLLPKVGETIEVREREGSPWRKHVVRAENISYCRWAPALWRKETTMRDLTEQDVEFSMIVEYEDDIPIKGNASAIDPETDAKNEAWIRHELKAGNEWAWCRVTITASWQGLHGTDSLGGCSYRNEADFTQEGGYYTDMRKAALSDLNEIVRSTIKHGSELAELLRG